MPMAHADQRTTAARGAPNQPPLARVAAEQACAIALHDIPADVVALAKTHLLDQLGVGLAAAALPRNRPLASVVSAFGTGGKATALGFDAPVPAAAAVLRNGALMHSLEYDATHTASVAHAGSVVAPVALAVCEETGASGARMLHAFVLGWEMFVRLGLAAPGSFSKHGFQFTAVGGPFAAALTAGLLLGLNQEQLTNALGIAGSQASGVMEFVHEGATVKALHGGWPAHAGLLAARLAEAGMTGPSTILEGAHGFYALYARDAEAPARLRSHLQTLGKHWHLREAALKVSRVLPLHSAVSRMPGDAAPPRARGQRTLQRSTARFRAAKRASSVNRGRRNCGPPRPIRRSSACPTPSVRCWSTARSPLRLSRDRQGPTFARAVRA